MLVRTVAAEVLREAARRKLLLALALLTVLVIGLSAWGFSRVPTLTSGGKPLGDAQQRLIVSQLLILLMFMFSFVLAFSAVFIAAPAVSGEVESGITLAILARPLSRTEFVAGKWLGLFAVMLAYTVGAVLLELGVVWIVNAYTPPRPFELLVFLMAEGTAILTFALALSTRLTGMVGGIIALVAFGIAWMGGIVGGVGAAFNNEAITHIGTVTRLLLPTDGLWRGAVWSLEPSAIIAANAAAGPALAANPFYAAEAPPVTFLVWSLLWIATMFALAVWSFRAREL